MKCPVCNKNIAHDALKCPYCKTRTGLLCPSCKTINPVGQLKCTHCGQELLKICSKCNGVNFPTATKCRKCGTSFGEVTFKNSASKIKMMVYYLLNLTFVHLSRGLRI